MAVCIQVQSVPVIGIFTEEPCNYRIIKSCTQIVLSRDRIHHLITCIVIIRPCPLTVGGKQFVSADIADMFTSFIFFWISPAFVFTSVIWFRQSYRYVFSPSLKVFPCGHRPARWSGFRHGRRYKYGCSPVSVVQVHHTCILWFLQGLFYYCSHLTM